MIAIALNEEWMIPPEYEDALEEIRTIYLINEEEHVYICSSQPSYEAWFMYHDPVFTDEADREEIHNYICGAETESVVYFNTRSVDPDEGRQLDPPEYDDMEELVEHYRANHPL